MHKIKEYYEKIYNMLDEVTPLSKDCGVLCDKACCKEEDEPAGMFVFPFEEELLKDASFGYMEESNCEYGEEKTAKIFYCTKPCNRSQRPLSCRIFPLTPYRKNGRIKLIMNPAAKKMCPLARSLHPSQLEEDFEENVMRAMNRITKIKDGDDYIDMLTEIADQFKELNKKLR